MSVCWKCGAAAEEHHRFCVHCGADQARGARGGAEADGAAAGADPLLGRTVLQKYRIEAPIGAGAMGTIYRAQQVNLGKTIVIKVLHRHLMEEAELVQRFHREARAASRLNHPNCVHIIDFGSLADGALFIAMEFIAGIDFSDLLERAYPLDHVRVVRIARQICSALDEAHANGVLHRDLKPENIMIEDRRNAPDHVKVVDFGIAKIEDGHNRSSRAFQTRVGIVCGTPEYMSPEQARGEKLDARSDLYALGVLLFRAVTDCMPFQGDSAIETVTYHITQPVPDPRQYRADLPASLADLIMTLLAKSREDRPASALDVHAELERIERELLAAPAPEALHRADDSRTAVDLRPISVLIEAAELPLPESRAEARPSSSQAGGSQLLAPSSGLAASGGSTPSSAVSPRSALMPPPRREVAPQSQLVPAPSGPSSSSGPRSALMPPPRRPAPASPQAPTAPLRSDETSSTDPEVESPEAAGRAAAAEDTRPLPGPDATLRPEPGRLRRGGGRASTDATLRDVGLAPPMRPDARAQEAITHRELQAPGQEPSSRRRWPLAVAILAALGLGVAAVLALT